MAPNRPEAARTAGSLRSLRTPWGCRVGAPSATEPRSVKAAEPCVWLKLKLPWGRVRSHCRVRNKRKHIFG